MLGGAQGCTQGAAGLHRAGPDPRCGSLLSCVPGSMVLAEVATPGAWAQGRLWGVCPSPASYSRSVQGQPAQKAEILMAADPEGRRNGACVLALLSIVVGCRGGVPFAHFPGPERSSSWGWRKPGGEWPAGPEGSGLGQTGSPHCLHLRQCLGVWIVPSFRTSRYSEHPRNVGVRRMHQKMKCCVRGNDCFIREVFVKRKWP